MEDNTEISRISALCSQIVPDLFFLLERISNFHAPLRLAEQIEIEIGEDSLTPTGIREMLRPVMTSLVLARSSANKVGQQQRDGLESTIRGFSKIVRRCAEANMDQPTRAKVIKVIEFVYQHNQETEVSSLCNFDNVKLILSGGTQEPPTPPSPIRRIDMDELLWQSSDEESCDSKCDTGDELMETPQQREKRLERMRQRHTRRKNKRKLRDKPRKTPRFPTFTNTNIVFYILRKLNVTHRDQVTTISFSKFVRRIVKIARNDPVFSRIVAPRDDKQLYWSFQQPLQQLVQGYESYRPHDDSNTLFTKLHALYCEKMQIEKTFAEAESNKKAKII